MRMLGALVLGGCGVQIGGEETPPSDVTDECPTPVETPVSWSEPALEGHSADEFLAMFPKTFYPTWWDGRDESLTLSAIPLGDTVIARDYPGQPCKPWFELEVEVSLVSSAGAIDETWWLQRYFSSLWTLEDVPMQVPVASLAGTLDWAAIAADATELVSSMRVTSDGADQGYLELSSPGTGEGGSEDVRTRFADW